MLFSFIVLMILSGEATPVTLGDRTPAAGEDIGVVLDDARAAWVVVRRVMDFRMADDYSGRMGRVVADHPEPLTRRGFLAAIEEYQNMEKGMTEEEAEERAGDEVAELQGERMRGS